MSFQSYCSHVSIGATEVLRNNLVWIDRMRLNQ